MIKADIEELIETCESLEECLEKGCEQEPADSFHGGLSYYGIYKNLRTKLKPIHETVVDGAMKASIESWVNEISDTAKEANDPMEVLDLLSLDPIMMLNSHGEDHVDMVANRAFELLQCCYDFPLTLYDLYILLCAIQVHDVGVVRGRDGHERRARDILREQEIAGISDHEINMIGAIACAHSGLTPDGNRDTIGALREEELQIKPRLLAALLRFADELADDRTRTNEFAIKEGLISKSSEIFHAYSQSLSRVEIVRNEANRTHIEIKLTYYLDEKNACETFGKYGQEVYLLDEIYSRTLKMERERRYCAQYLKRCIDVGLIRVAIVVSDADNPLGSQTYTYKLEDGGYPEYALALPVENGVALPKGVELAEKFAKGAGDGAE